MAYMNQERKKALSVQVKTILNAYGVKGTLSVDNHSSLVLTITESKLDFFNDSHVPWGQSHMQVNTYHIASHFKDGKAKEFLLAVNDAMNVGNHDRSDIQSDYHDVGWYVNINIGRWNKPYKLLVK